MSTYDYMQKNSYEIKDNIINNNFKDYQMNDYNYRENNSNNNLYFNDNNQYSNNHLSNFYRNNELTQAEKLLLGEYKNSYNKKYESINYIDTEKKENFLNNSKNKLTQDLHNNNYNYYYSLDNNYKNYYSLDNNYNQKFLLNNENEIPTVYLRENYRTNNNEHSSINYPLNNPILNENINNYNNKSREENYLNINKQISPPSQNFENYIIPLSTNNNANKYYFNNFNYYEEPRNNILSKTQNILNNTYIANYYNHDIHPNIQNLKRNYSNNNIFYKNKYNDNSYNNDIHLINNHINNENINKRNNIKINNIKTNQNNINGINSNKKNKISFTPEIRKKSNPFIKKNYSENSNENPNVNYKKAKKVKNNSVTRSKKTKNKINKFNKINKEIVKPYRYIPSKTSLLINNNENQNLKKINTKEINPKLEEKKKDIINILPLKIPYKDLKNKSAPKIRNNPETKNPYLYKTYQINTTNTNKMNKKNKDKISLFNYSSIISDLINKNSKNSFKF